MAFALSVSSFLEQKFVNHRFEKIQEDKRKEIEIK